MFKPGDTIDAWTVERQLGSGGMGSVYLCRNRGARRILAAVKVLDSRLDASPKVRARFVREAELLFSLQHPNIVKVRNVRMDATPPYLEMEFVEGPNLDAVLEGGAIAAGDAAAIAAQVADALAYVHGRGIFHRDVKPSNVVMEADGTAKLVDFGIAAEAGSTTVSEAGQAIGSALYVPPEWLSGTVDPAQWDLYALGVVLHELLTGESPFVPPSAGGATQQFIATLAAKQGLPPLDPTDAPEALRAIVRALTHPDPAVRPRDAASVRAQLQALHDLPRDAAFTARCARREAEPARAPTSGASTWSGTAAGAEDLDEGAPVHAATAATRETASAPDPRSTPGPSTPETPETRVTPVRDARASLLALAGIVLAGGVAWALWPAPAAAPRPVRITLPAAADSLHVLWDGTPVALAPEGAGARAEFAAVAPGAHRVEVRQGAGCAADPLPVWCGVQTHEVAVPAGEGVHAATLAVASASAREVVVTESTGALFALQVGEHAAGSPRGAVQVALRPGAYPARATGGAGCPDACGTWEGTIEVPWGEGAWATTITLAAAVPATGEAPAPPAPVTTTAGVTGERTAGTQAVASAAAPAAPREGASGRSVRVRDLATWLEAHPEWQPEAARTSGRADEDYLKGWTGAAPPSLTDAPVLATNPGLATAFCAGKGGIARVDAVPTAWTDTTTAAWHEWRRDGDGIVSLQSSGSASPPVNAGRTGKYTGFRCALP